MALTRRIHRGGKPTKGKKGKGHCTKGGKKSMKKALVPLAFLEKSKKPKKSRKSKRGGFPFLANNSHPNSSFWNPLR